MQRIETMAAGVVAVRGGADLTAWAALLVESACDRGQDLVLDVPAAVEWVYGLSSPNDSMSSTVLVRVARDYRRAEADLLEHTRGQPFRLETHDGPLFVGWPLFEFAGGRDLEDGEMPTWDGGVEAAA